MGFTRISEALTNNYRAALHQSLKIDRRRINANNASDLFRHMISSTPPPPISSFNSLFSSLIMTNHYPRVISYIKLLADPTAAGPSPDFKTFNILINCYSRMNLGSLGFSSLGLMLQYGYRPNIITFNALIKGLCLEKKSFEAVALFQKMVRLGSPPDVVTYSTLIHSLCKEGLMIKAEKLFAEMKMAGLSPDVVSYNCLIDGLRRSGNAEGFARKERWNRE